MSWQSVVGSISYRVEIGPNDTHRILDYSPAIHIQCTISMEGRVVVRVAWGQPLARYGMPRCQEKLRCRGRHGDAFIFHVLFMDEFASQPSCHDD